MRLIVLLCLAACGAPYVPARTCEHRGVTVQVESERLDCAFYERRVDAALELLAQHKWAQPEEFDGLQVWAHDESPTIVCAISGASAGGCYHTGENWLETTRSANGLAHEMLHHVDFLRGRRGRNHNGWGLEGTDAEGAPYTLAGEPEPVYPGSWRDLTQRYMYYWEFAP